MTIASKKRQALNWTWQKAAPPHQPNRHELTIEVAEDHKTDHQFYELDLTGICQTRNLLTVLESCYQMRQKGWAINEEVIHNGLRHTKKITSLHGRWEIIRQSPLVVLDVAHNVDG